MSPADSPRPSPMAMMLPVEVLAIRSKQRPIGCSRCSSRRARNAAGKRNGHEAHRTSLLASVRSEIESKDAFVIFGSLQHLGVAQRAASIVVPGAPMFLHAQPRERVV